MPTTTMTPSASAKPARKPLAARKSTVARKSTAAPKAVSRKPKAAALTDHASEMLHDVRVRGEALTARINQLLTRLA